MRNPVKVYRDWMHARSELTKTARELRYAGRDEFAEAIVRTLNKET